MIDCISAKFELETYGFTVLEEVIDEEYIEKLKREFDILSESKDMQHLIAKNPIFFNLIDNSYALSVIESILSSNIILSFLSGRVLAPYEKAQELHSDIPFPLANTEKPIAFNVAFLIDDFTLENGATVILPLSHLCRAPVPPNNPSMKYLHKVTAPRGSALIFNANCWHGSSVNMTSNPRRTIFAQYMVYWSRFHVNSHLRFNKNWFELLTNRQKKLLRMEKGVGAENNADFQNKLYD